MKKLVSVMLCMLICIISISSEVTISTIAIGRYFKGSGIESDPYQISSSKDLFQLAELINDEQTNPDYRYCYYIQTADIDLENEPFTPIGIFYGRDGKLTSNALFAGSYDGNYHVIKNLNIDSDNRYCGLFGRIGQSSYDNSNCIVKSLSVEGVVQSTDSQVGGIIGEMGYGSSIQNCSFNGTVIGNSLVGSCIGYSYCGGIIRSCYANAKVIGTFSDAETGGIVGRISVGNNNVTGSTDAILNNCYFTGTVECVGSNFGGICGKTYINTARENSTITFFKNFYLISACNEAAVNGKEISGCTKFVQVSLKACADMLGSPFVDNIDETFNDGYPIFEWQSTPYQFQGSGTQEDPYQISSKEELGIMRDLVNSTYFNPVYGHAYYIQTKDIDLENEPWIPIGLGYDDAEDGVIGQGTYNCLTKMFFGQYDGNGHNILNLNVDGNYHYCGLFGAIRGAYSDSTGTPGVICNLVVYGTVIQKSETNGDTAGGIVGVMQYGATLNECAFIGDVNGKNAGGVCGYLYSGGDILNCYHNGSVTAESERICGGVVGRIRFSQYNYDGESASVRNCYHVNGTVSCDNYSGGITGDCVYYNGIQNTITIDNCYFSKGSAVNTISSNATLDNTREVLVSYMKKIAEDLGEAYVDNTDVTLNNGYPVFKWQLEHQENIIGDVNDDGLFNVADAVLLQKWILAVPNTELANWKAADFCDDDRLDVFDLCLMKQTLIEQEQ